MCICAYVHKQYRGPVTYPCTCICIKNHNDLSIMSAKSYENYGVSPPLALPACCNSKSTPPGWLVAKSVRLATKPSTAIHRSPWKPQKQKLNMDLPTW